MTWRVSDSVLNALFEVLDADSETLMMVRELRERREAEKVGPVAWIHKDAAILKQGKTFHPSVESEFIPVFAHAALKVPDGMALVPRVITDDMAVAFAEQWYSKRRCIDDCDMQDAYAAMLAAAESPK